VATFSISNIKISGLSCCVPKNIERNIDIPFMTSDEIEQFIEATGISERRVAEKNVCTSDLCFSAAEKLLLDLNWNKNDVEILIFVTQSADYILPVTSTLLQNRLGLSNNCLAFDIPLGCSGYVYGMSIISGLMNASKFKKGLLLVGDTSTKLLSKLDKSTLPLFGDAGTATAFVYDENADDILFDLGSDGSGSNAIIIKDGGARNRITHESLEYKSFDDGIQRNNCQLVLEGMDVFSFGISQAPKTIKLLSEKYSLDFNLIDYFVFHQANLMMNKMIVKKLKIPSEKVPYSLYEFGNTSSATIPLTIATKLKDELTNAKKQLICCGFGVGLSWGSVKVTFDDVKISNLIEL
jgi:3-oxoacyl-[acyl-carrier-protein] synthase-3